MPQSVTQCSAMGLARCLEGKKGQKLLVALSGGADSVAMLHLLREAAPTWGYTLAACHVNHGIRGEEAQRDEDFCKALCKKLGISLETVRLDVPTAAKERKMGLEECAREMRYGVLRQVARQWGCDLIATAHHAEDHLETVLFHLARGCGTEGLTGIAPVRGCIIRPMLYCEKAQILSYLDGIGADFCTDSTNANTDFTRNRIRGMLLPEMRAINPRVAQASLTASEILRQDDAFIWSFVPEEMPPLCELARLPDPVLTRLLRREYERAGGAGASHGQMLSLLALVKEGRTGGEVSLPCGITARRTKGELVFVPTLREKKRERGFEKHPVLRAGDTVFSDGPHIVLIESEQCGNNTQKVYNLSIKTEVDSAILSLGLFWRARLPGDTVRIGGMTRKVKKLLWQTGMSPEQRDALPILCDERGPIWVPGFPVRDDLLPKAGGKSVLLCLIEGKKQEKAQP